MSEDRCCCGVCHVKTGTWITAILHFMFGVADSVGSIVHLVRNRKGSTYEARYVVIGHLILTFLWLLMVVLLMLGLHKNKPILILPHLIVTVIYVMFIVASSIWLVVTGLSLFQAIVVVCGVLIIFGLLWVEWKCYKYISSIA